MSTGPVVTKLGTLPQWLLITIKVCALLLAGGAVGVGATRLLTPAPPVYECEAIECSVCSDAECLDLIHNATNRCMSALVDRNKQIQEMIERCRFNAHCPDCVCNPAPCLCAHENDYGYLYHPGTEKWCTWFDVPDLATGTLRKLYKGPGCPSELTTP